MILFYMLCITCKNLSLQIICKDCQKNLLSPSFHKREIEEGFFNYSFYTLSELEDLISSKYYFHGDRVFNILAKLSFAKFAQNFTFTNQVLAIPIDDHARHDFSHTAILARTMNIPALIGVDYVDECDGVMAIVDGYEGKLYLNPDDVTLAKKRELQKADERKQNLLQEL